MTTLRLLEGLTAQNVEAVDLTTKSQKEKIEALNFNVGNGYIKSEGQTITFKEGIMGVTDIKNNLHKYWSFGSLLY